MGLVGRSLALTAETVGLTEEEIQRLPGYVQDRLFNVGSKLRSALHQIHTMQSMVAKPQPWQEAYRTPGTHVEYGADDVYVFPFRREVLGVMTMVLPDGGRVTMRYNGHRPEDRDKVEVLTDMAELSIRPRAANCFDLFCRKR